MITKRSGRQASGREEEGDGSLEPSLVLGASALDAREAPIEVGKSARDVGESVRDRDAKLALAAGELSLLHVEDGDRPGGRVSAELVDGAPEFADGIKGVGERLCAAEKVADRALDAGEALLDRELAPVDAAGGMGAGHDRFPVPAPADPAPERAPALSARAVAVNHGPGDPSAMASEKVARPSDKLTTDPPKRRSVLRIVEAIEGGIARLVERFAKRSPSAAIDLDIESDLMRLSIDVRDAKRGVIADLEDAARVRVLMDRLDAQVVALKVEAKKLAETEAEARIRAKEIGRDVDCIYQDASELAHARAEGERVADARYIAAAAGDPELEAFVEQHRVRGLRRLVERFGSKAAVR